MSQVQVADPAATTGGAVDLLGLTCAEFAAAAESAVGGGAALAARMYRHLMATGRFEPELAAPIQAAAWKARFSVTLPAVTRLIEDPGGTAKAVLAVPGGSIEMVRIPMRHDASGAACAWTLCVSSQLGCRMGCTFCETGRMGLVRQLTAGEIVAQVMAARCVLGWEVRNVVFMGMGEALDNADNLIQAIRVLTGKPGWQYSFERLTVCTSGHAEGIARLAAQGWKRLNLSISLNGGTDAVRSALMPVNRRTPLADLQRVLAAYPQRTNFTLGVNYCLLPGINDRREDAAAVAAFCRPLGRVLVNLIPYNPGSVPLTRAPTEDEVVRWVDWLRAEGLAVRRRVTKGRAIMAACGQLGDGRRRQQRQPLPSSA